MTAALIKRLRRRWTGLQVLIVREAHHDLSDGVIHNNLIITGLPFVIRGKSRAERQVREHWAAVGGGFAAAKVAKRGSAQAIGRYVGKYVTKEVQAARVARRCRIWRRTRNFAPDVRMIGYRPPLDLVAAGRIDFTTGEVLPSPWMYVGWWDDLTPEAPPP
jgi:hypothetical protein